MSDIIKEDAGVIVGTGLLVTAIGAALAAAHQHLQSNKLEAQLLKCYSDDYLLIDIKSKTEVPIILSGFLKRSKLVKRLIQKNQVAIVSNMETARLLKLHLPKYRIFKMLFTQESITFGGEQFFKIHDDLFKIFGSLRSSTVITWDGMLKAFVTLGISKRVDEIPECAKANLYYMALVMRQLLLYKDDIDSITFTSKFVGVRHQY